MIATCGACAWRTEGGFCRRGERRVKVAMDEPACPDGEAAPLDCLACGACCREAYSIVPVGWRDPVRKQHPNLITCRDGRLEMQRSGTRCAALEGPDGGPFRCVIYLDRARVCRDFEAGGRHCLDARRRVGLAS